MSDIPADDHPMHPSPPENLLESLSDDARLDFSNWMHFLRSDTGLILKLLPNEASKVVFTAAANDSLALIRHVNNFDGRSAAHSARSLFEHSVNFLDVVADHSAAERYLRHRAVTIKETAENDWWIELLPISVRRKEVERLKKLGKRNCRDYRKAIADYGSSFSRGWASASLRQRAEVHDLDELYRGYKILSAVIHGNNGSMIGLIRPIAGVPTHRIGPDLDILPTAIAEGLMSLSILTDRLAEVIKCTEAEDLAVLSARLLTRVGAVNAVAAQESKRMWPKEPLESLHALAAIYPSGEVRWYQHNEFEGSVVRADPVDGVPPMQDLIDVIREAGVYSRLKRPVLVSCFETRVSARRNARRVPASALEGDNELAQVADFVAGMNNVYLFNI